MQQFIHMHCTKPCTLLYNKVRPEFFRSSDKDCHPSSVMSCEGDVPSLNKPCRWALHFIEFLGVAGYIWIPRCRCKHEKRCDQWNVSQGFSFRRTVINVGTVKKNIKKKWKSAQRDANTACQKFSPRHRPLYRGRMTAKI